MGLHSTNSSNENKLYIPPHLRNRGSYNGMDNAFNDRNCPPRYSRAMNNDAFRGRSNRGFKSRSCRQNDYNQHDSRWQHFDGER